ncbi:hypothetical protein PISMIDRAFT_688124 [Pisolithus microcarpus 441]|uniref:Uncharacterized protein n=1 Tax=Pisolithus microcarpus 441 TaxID=765257 RepID=A0A0C9XPB4_9AGAM|nr:hypothetical protein PISMIDRAFT_688124 [Pisolithus microcarpus 441]
MVGVTQDYFPFGFGKHRFFRASPRRFLGANELKTMLPSRPTSIHWDLNVIDPTVRVMVRQRTCN